MDMQAIAKRIAQDHGITVLEKDVIETLEKLKAENKDKITGAGETQVPPVTGADDTQKVPAPLTAPLSTGASTTTAPVKTVPAPLQTDSAQANPAPAPLPTGSAPLQTTTGAPSTPVKTASEQPISLKIPSGVKPLPITLIDELIMEGYSRDGIESILKENGHNAYRRLIGERMKVVKPVGKGAVTPASSARTLIGTGAAPKYRCGTIR
jgi:hypothetical protein